MSMTAVILSIGDELVLGQVPETNAGWLSAHLFERGVSTLYHKTIADDEAATVKIVMEACKEADLVVITGGLGPTADDLTRQALAAVMGRPLDMHPPSLDRIRAFFRSLGRDMPPSNRIQAMAPRGADVLVNEWGTAPGIKLKHGNATVLAFPGVPHEMMKMAGRHLFPLLEHRTGAALAVKSLSTFGAGESTVAEKLGELMRRDRNPLVGTTVSGGVVTVRIRCEAVTAVLAARKLGETVHAVQERLGALIFSNDDETLAETVGRLARERRVRIAVAESCTGGLAARMLTDPPGASMYFVGGWIVYSNDMKHSQLGVPLAMLEYSGAVSEATACAMAAGALDRSGADMAIGITGIAGPDGGSTEKPVGMVWIALAVRGGAGPVTRAECFRFPGDRSSVRDRAAKTALNLLRLELLKP